MFRSMLARAGCAIAFISIGTAAMSQPPQGPPPKQVAVDKVRLETVEKWRSVTGELRSARRSIVAAEAQGKVIEVLFEPGDEVDQGRVLARIDDTLAKLEVERALATVQTRDAAIAERQASLEKARRDLGRYEESFSRQGSSQIEIDEVRTLVTEWEAKLAQSKADLAWAKADHLRAVKRLEDMTIKAPFSGSVVAKLTEAGQWLSDGDPVVDLVDLDTIDAWLDVPESVVARLRLRPDSAAAPEVDIIVPALGTPVEGQGRIRAPVSALLPTADRLSRLFPVRVRIDNSSRRLRPGMSITGSVPTGEPQQALTIHKDALLWNATGAYVYLNAGGIAQIAPVTVLSAEGNRVVVESPALAPDIGVVVEGNERLFPGQPLLIPSP